MFPITAYSVMTPLGDAAESVRRIRAVDTPDVFSLPEDRYRECMQALPYTVPSTLDRTALTALWLFHDICGRASLSRDEAAAVPIIVANSKGGVRTLVRGLNAQVPDARFMFDAPFYNVSSALAEFAGVRAPMLSVQSACATGMTALISGCRMFERGYEQVLVIGVESAAIDIIEYGFNAMGVITNERIRPFSSRRSGFSIAEGGAAVLISRKGHPLAQVDCWADIHDNTHPIRFDENGVMIGKALRMLDVKRADVDLISAHATATGNDIPEAKAIHDVFGDVPVTGLKPYLGHMLGASALAEIALTIELARGGYIAHLPFSDPIDEAVPANILVSPREAHIRRFIKLAYGFGGSITAASISVSW
ncbi:MAG: beta-ketoacyl synthase N-terminal-like domain-containing protein [Spirochaetota bacterium]